MEQLTATTSAGADAALHLPPSMERSQRLRRIGYYALLSVIGAIFLVPFYWMIVASVRPQSEFFHTPISLVPRSLSLQNYHSLFALSDFARGVLNSVIFAGAAVILQVFFASLAGYTFAKLRFRFREALFVGVLATMMLPASIQLIPNFLMMAHIHWINTYWSLIVPGIADAFGI